MHVKKGLSSHEEETKQKLILHVGFEFAWLQCRYIQHFEIFINA